MTLANRLFSRIHRSLSNVFGSFSPSSDHPSKLESISSEHADYSSFISPARGTAVLGDVLRADEFERKLRSGIIVPSTMVPYRKYILKWNEKIDVWEHEKHVGYLCVSPRRIDSKRHSVAVDTYLAFYMNLVLAEENFLKVANLHRKPAYIVGY